jgi:hypothetical protein
MEPGNPHPGNLDHAICVGRYEPAIWTGRLAQRESVPFTRDHHLIKSVPYLSFWRHWRQRLAAVLSAVLIERFGAAAIPQFARRLTKFIQFNVRRPHGFHSERRPSYPSVTSRAWLGWEKRDISHSLRNVAQCGALSVRRHQTPNHESGGREFESLRARQKPNKHWSKWTDRKSAMQNQKIHMASAWQCANPLQFDERHPCAACLFDLSALLPFDCKNIELTDSRPTGSNRPLHGRIRRDQSRVSNPRSCSIDSKKCSHDRRLH